ncbi:LuxR C-terminal-related transcriptional regulator [Streptomyces sp. NPDC057242]|uniref:LuxR C-terminal-related transcriptional regulator n=1 Tax=unclassified Streptomyces TaxID=2593676 RepID=UPI003631AAFC
MSDTPSIGAAFGAAVAQALGTHLGTHLTDDEATAAGQAAYTALVRSGWHITEGLGQHPRRISPTLWDYDPALLAGLARGYSTNEISTSTGVPLHTVRRRMERLRTRLDARSASHAVAIAYRAGWMRSLAPEPRGYIRLSARQHQVLELIADGLTNDQIATRLGCSRNSVITHVHRLYRALDALRPGATHTSTRPRAVALAYQHGLLPLPTAPSATAA